MNAGSGRILTQLAMEGGKQVRLTAFTFFRNQRGTLKRIMEPRPKRIGGAVPIPVSSQQSQSNSGEKRRITVAERLLQSFPNQAQEASTSGHPRNAQQNNYYARPKESYGFHTAIVNTQLQGRDRRVGIDNHRDEGQEFGSRTKFRLLASQSKQVTFSTSTSSNTNLLEGYKVENPHDPHPIDPLFMSNTMSRIAKVAGRPIENFYSDQTSNLPQMVHVPSRRPNSRIRFNLPGENETETEEMISSEIRDDNPDIVLASLKKLRQWEHTTYGHLVGQSSVYGTVADGTRFNILSYNVLAPYLLDNHKYLYKDCNPKALEWEYRFELFMKEIAEFGADIICLQEVEAMHFLGTYEPRMLQMGFKGVYKKRTRDKEDGCAIFWRQNLFSLIGKLDVEFYQPHIPILDRDNVGLLVKLQSKLGRRPKLVVGTTHILYNPKRNDVKLAQVQLLLSEIDRFAFSGFNKSGEATYNHMILTGDFNADPFNSIIRFIADGELQFLSADGRRPNVLLKKGMTDFIPDYVGISDQCQHYKVVLERFKMFRTTRKTVFEMDLNVQAALVNLYCDNDNYPAVAPRGSAISASARHSVSAISRPTSSGKHNFSNDVDIVDLTGDDQDFEAGAILNRDNLPANDRKYNFNVAEHNRLLGEIYKSGTVCTFGSGELSHKLRMRNVYSPKLDRTENNDSIATTRQNVWTCVDYIFYSMQWSDMQRRRIEGNLKLLRRLGLPTRSQCKQNGHLPSLAVPSDHFPLVAEFVLK